MKITIDPKLCLGCGTCAAIAPKSFCLNKDGKAEVLESPGDDDKTIKEAIESCPVGVIKIIN
jgi:ferredoxin